MTRKEGSESRSRASHASHRDHRNYRDHRDHRDRERKMLSEKENTLLLDVTKKALKKIRTASLLLQDCTDLGMRNVLIQEIEKGIRMIPQEHPALELILWVKISGWNIEGYYEKIIVADKAVITKYAVKIDWHCSHLFTLQENAALSVLVKRHPELARFWDLYAKENSDYEIEVHSWYDIQTYLAGMSGPFPLITVEREETK